MQVFLLLFNIKLTVERSRGPKRGQSTSVTVPVLQLSRVAQAHPTCRLAGWPEVLIGAALRPEAPGFCMCLKAAEMGTWRYTG